jgi:hypothetical protein
VTLLLQSSPVAETGSVDGDTDSEMLLRLPFPVPPRLIAVRSTGSHATVDCSTSTDAQRDQFPIASATPWDRTETAPRPQKDWALAPPRCTGNSSANGNEFRTVETLIEAQNACPKTHGWDDKGGHPVTCHISGTYSVIVR